MTAALSRRRKLAYAAVVGLLLWPPLIEGFAGAVLHPCWTWQIVGKGEPGALVTVHTGLFRAEWRRNSQGAHDREHAFAKPDGGRRVVCIGDSFLDGPGELTLPAALEQALPPGFEVVNLARKGLDPADYYLLARDVAPRYAPDLVLVFLYAGNDFLWIDRELAGFERARHLFRRYPEASWYGRCFPRTTILFADAARSRLRTRWDPAESWGQDLGKVDDLGELAGLLRRWTRGNRAAIKAHLERGLTAQEVADILVDANAPMLLAYLVAVGMRAPEDSPILERVYPRLQDEDQKQRRVQEFVRRCRELAAGTAARFAVVLIPQMDVDPECRSLMERLGAASTPILDLGRRQGRNLLAALRADGIPVLDLEPALAGLPGTYLKFDGHWTETGVRAATAAVKPYLEQDSLVDFGR